MDRELFQQVEPAKKFLLLTVVLGVLGAAATIAQMFFLSRVIGGVFLENMDLSGAWSLLALLFAAILLRAGLLWVKEVAAQRGAVQVKSRLREKLFSHLMRLGPAYTERESAGELTATATEGVERLDDYFARYLPQVPLSGIVPLMIFAFLLWVDWISAVILLFTAPVIPMLMIAVGKYSEKHIQKQWTALSHMEGYFLESLQGLPTLKALNQSLPERERVAHLSERFRQRTMKVLRYAFLSGMTLELMTSISIAVIAVELGVRLLRGDVPFEPAFLVLLLAPEFYRPLRELGTHRHAGMEGKAAAQRIFEVLDTGPQASVGEGVAIELDRPSQIQLEGVSYTYPGGLRPALSGLELTLPRNTTTAVVGPSGSGKSTLVKLLMRFIDPDEGSISADGLPIAQASPGGWRENCALVPQAPYLFYGTVMENIRLAKPEASDGEIEEAAKLAGITDFTDRLPSGYETVIGERGGRLSGGEAQRLAISRAFLKDAPVLILDEPTSNLDPESEELVNGAVKKLSEGRTTLIIAHRLNTVYRADRIAVLEEGELTELGTHSVLVEAGGLYAELVGERVKT